MEYGHQFLDSFLDFILKPNFENLFVKFRSNFGQDIFLISDAVSFNHLNDTIGYPIII